MAITEVDKSTSTHSIDLNEINALQEQTKNYLDQTIIYLSQQLFFLGQQKDIAKLIEKDIKRIQYEEKQVKNEIRSLKKFKALLVLPGARNEGKFIKNVSSIAKNFKNGHIHKINSSIDLVSGEKRRYDSKALAICELEQKMEDLLARLKTSQASQPQMQQNLLIQRLMKQSAKISVGLASYYP